MKIGIISDIHDNLANLDKFMAWARAEKIDTIICLGDVVNAETLGILAGNFKKIFLVEGNMKIYNEKELEKYDNIVYGDEFAIFEIGGRKFGLCHEPFKIKKILEKEKPEIIFYGHTHKPWIEEEDGIKLVNPGNLANVFFRPSFASWDTETDKLELKLLDTI